MIKCNWCGKTLNENQVSFCSSECEDKLNTQIKKWNKEGRCLNCGEPKYKNYNACFECLKELTINVKGLDQLEKIARRNK